MSPTAKQGSSQGGVDLSQILQLAEVINPSRLTQAFLCTFHQRDEALEVMLGVVWTGRGFRMILNGDYRQRLVAHAFHAAVVKIYVCYFHVSRQAVGQDSEAMIV